MMEETKAESERIDELIRISNELRIKAVAEMMKHPLTPEQKRIQIRRHWQEADRVWNEGRDSSGE